MYGLLYILFVAIGNRYIRGITWGKKSKEWPWDALPFNEQPWWGKVIQLFSSKYAFAVYMGVLAYFLMGTLILTSVAISLGAGLGFAKGSNFDVLTKPTAKNYMAGLIRGLWLAIPVVGLICLTVTLSLYSLAAALLLALSYPSSYWLVGKVYGEKKHSVGIAEMLWGLAMGITIWWMV